MDEFHIKRTLEKLQSEPWLLEKGTNYMRQFAHDGTGISVSHWSHLSVGMHAHRYYEISIIISGGCVHTYRGSSVPLIPGDVFLVAPGEQHSYTAQLPVELYVCQFFAERLADEILQMLKSVNQPEDASDAQQNVLHLDQETMEEVVFLLEKMIREQHGTAADQRLVKKACLELILVNLKRVHEKESTQGSSLFADEKRIRIQNTIDYINAHLDERVELEALAKISCWSEGYFRAVFKEVTGFSPVEYLNRLRIVKAIEFMQRENLPVSAAAMRVGIYDKAYFSRLFKKVIGCSPREFRSGIVS